MNKFTTTIKQIYFDMKMEDLKIFGYFEEYKDITPFWKRRFIHLSLPTKAFFLVGSEPHHFILIEKKVISKQEIPEKYRSMINTEKVLVFRCTQSSKPNIETNNQKKLNEFKE